MTFNKHKPVKHLVHFHTLSFALRLRATEQVMTIISKVSKDWQISKQRRLTVIKSNSIELS